MSLRSVLNYILYSLPLVIALSCARQTNPSGGPKDTIPPQAINTNPVKGKTNVKPNSITLTFDEAIQLNNPKEQIIITPDIEKKYQITAKNKTATLKFETDLKDSTTYLINFRDAVQDLTEKNPARNLKLAFSTGTFIDSLKIQGKTFDLLKNIDYKEVTVALYESDTFNIFKNKPQYITKSDEQGNFIFEFLKPGTYYIYAFEDKNRNLIVDSKTESYAFKAQPINLTTNVKSILLNLIRLDSRPLRLTSKRPYNTYNILTLTKGLRNYRISSPATDSVYSAYADASSINVYNTFPDQDSTQIELFALDSLGQTIDTTFFIKFPKRENTPERFSTSITSTTLIKSKGILTITGSFSKPIFLFRTDSAFLKKDSLTTIQIEQADITIDNQNKIFQIQKSLGPNAFPPEPTTTQTTTPKQKPQIPTLLLGKGTFITVENDSSKTLSQNVTPLRDEDLGVISVKIQTTKPNYIIELITKDFKIVQRRVNTPNPTFTELQPGDYLIRFTIDNDGDHQWSPGNFFQKKETETFIYYANEKKNQVISLKANWELGPLLIKF